MIRAFVAIDLPDDIRRNIRDAQTQLKNAAATTKVSWSNIDNLHLTLQFLGDVEESVVSRISAELETVAGKHGAFEVTVAGAGTFPDAHRPRVLWIGCEDAGGGLKSLALDVHSAMQTLGFQTEHREFAPHLTISRIKFPRPDAALTRALDCLKTQVFGTMQVNGVHLFQSRLHPHGSIYTKISSHKLKCRPTL